MMGFLGFVFKYKFLIIIAALGVLLAAQTTRIVLFKSDITVLQAEKKSLKVQLDESQANVMQLQNDIQAQNDAIDKFKKAADVRAAKNAIEIKKAKETAEDFKKQANDLLNRKAPVGKECETANSLINEEIRNDRK